MNDDAGLLLDFWSGVTQSSSFQMVKQSVKSFCDTLSILVKYKLTLLLITETYEQTNNFANQKGDFQVGLFTCNKKQTTFLRLTSTNRGFSHLSLEPSNLIPVAQCFQNCKDIVAILNDILVFLSITHHVRRCLFNKSYNV